MESLPARWSPLPEHFPTTTALATPPLWDALVQLGDSASSTPSTLALAVKSRLPRIQQRPNELATVLIRVREAAKAELREADLD
ncbi:hypothetical protein JCM3766R1_005749, partial [Sporobolomyces carnicolor]